MQLWKLDKKVCIRFTDEELKELDENAWKAHKNRTAFIKSKLKLEAKKASKKK